jgi:hypothetical protein
LDTQKEGVGGSCWLVSGCGSFYVVAKNGEVFLAGCLARFGRALAIYPGVTTLSGENEIQRPNGP